MSAPADHSSMEFMLAADTAPLMGIASGAVVAELG
jgi:hypothetical protein